MARFGDWLKFNKLHYLTDLSKKELLDKAMYGDIYGRYGFRIVVGLYKMYGDLQPLRNYLMKCHPKDNYYFLRVFLEVLKKDPERAKIIVKSRPDYFHKFLLLFDDLTDEEEIKALRSFARSGNSVLLIHFKDRYKISKNKLLKLPSIMRLNFLERLTFPYLVECISLEDLREVTFSSTFRHRDRVEKLIKTYRYYERC